jgi:hypothetical protein
MKHFVGLTLLVVFFACTCDAQQHCYTFKNTSPGNVHLDFRYSGALPLGFGTILSADIPPNHEWPEKQWCWSTPAGFTAIVIISGSGELQGNSPLVLGNGPGTSASGTYAIGQKSVSGDWYGFKNGAPNIDREKELHENCKVEFQRITVPQSSVTDKITFNDLCHSINKTCQKVLDWEGNTKSCGEVSHKENYMGTRDTPTRDGSRIALCR